MDEVLKDKILANLGLLAMQTCIEWKLDSVNTSDIYHVPHASWQSGELIKCNKVCTVYDVAAFEQAVQNSVVHVIFVPYAAEVTQGIARSILLRNPLPKQVFWEAGKAVPTTEPGAAPDPAGL